MQYKITEDMALRMLDNLEYTHSDYPEHTPVDDNKTIEALKKAKHILTPTEQSELESCIKAAKKTRDDITYSEGGELIERDICFALNAINILFKALSIIGIKEKQD